MKEAGVSMSVLVTLVFADEAHRESWLIANGFIPPMGPYSYRRADYDHRQASQNLVYSVGALDSEGQYVEKR